MGKKWFHRKKKGQEDNKGGSKYEKPKRERSTTDNYAELIRENKDFEKYYKAQKIVSEEEWDEFITCLKDDLPAAFRLTGSKSHARALLDIIQNKFFKQIESISCEESTNENVVAVKPLKPVCLPWYPDGLGWQLNLTRKDIRRSEAYWKLHQFLISETETGNISRQESVSMLPPLLLDVKSHHKVLDMCAAPGSKTAQIIEYLHSSSEEDTIPSGVVIANDSDNKRCYMLTHQVKRLQSPTLMITNHDASFMPNIHHTRQDGTVGPMKFDRILCDVPCSGDGTLRKNFDVWTKWNAVNGANLHGLQLRIARRGLEMLAVGGKMVYSTCSLNPLENEAVVNRLLAENGDSVALIEPDSRLHGLKYEPGLEEWTIMNRELEIVASPEEIPEKNSNLLHKNLFPPTKEKRSCRNLKRCVRILPHRQDTGAFFMAVIEKKSPLPGEKIYDPSKKDIEQDKVLRDLTQRIKPPPKKRHRGFKEEPFYYMDRDNEIWQSIFAFYGFKDEVDPSLFLRRTLEGKTKNLYFTNALIKDLVLQNEQRLKMINTGVKVLVRCDNKGATCDFRLAQDGSEVLFPLFANRKLTVTKEDMITMLLNEDVDIPPQINVLASSTQQQCAFMECGSVTFTYKKETGDFPFEITLVGWKGKYSVRCYVVRNERVHYLRLLDGDISSFVRNKFEEQRILEAKIEKQNSEDKIKIEGEQETENGQDQSETMDQDEKMEVNDNPSPEKETIEDVNTE